MNNNFDILIKEGSVIDGTGIPSYKTDIGIREGKIKKVGHVSGTTDRMIDASRLIISPGFIDIHNHADHAILAFPNAECYIMQGVTTSLVGNCGLSMAPINSDYLDLTRRYLSPFLRNDFDCQWDWRTTKEYFDKVKNNGTAINLAPLVGQGTLRIAVKGFEMTDASEEEMKTMKNILRKELEEGAFGLSTGLVYPPGSYSMTEELVSLASILRDYNALYASHLRNESDQLIESIEEAIKIGEINGISVEISHHKAIGKDNWGKVNTTLKMIEDAITRGVKVNCDVYPYTAAMTTVSSLLPPWALEGGIGKMLERLNDAEFRTKMKRDIIEGRMKGENWIKGIGWENIVVSECPFDRKSEGKSLKGIFKEKNESSDPFQGLFKWLLEIKGEATMVFFCMDEKDVRTVIAHPISMIASDSWVIAPSGGGKPHPRGYGTFPRVLGKYVREERVLSLEEAIKKMTFLPAQKIGLKDRGVLKEGYYADIVIFNPDKVRDMATFENPHQYPKGIDYVMVNGQMVVDDGKITGIRPGMILKK